VCTGVKIKLNSDQIITNRTAVFLCRKNISLDDYYYCAYLVELSSRILKFAAFTFTEIPQGIKSVRLDRRKVCLSVEITEIEYCQKCTLTLNGYSTSTAYSTTNDEK